MSIIVKCDGDECYKTDHSYDGTLYSLSDSASDMMNDVFEIYDCEHLCKDCIEEYNIFEDILFIDENSDTVEIEE